MVEREAQLEEEAAFEDAGGHGGVADRAEEDDVVGLDSLKVLVGECIAGGVPARCSQVEVGRGVLDALIRQDAVQNLQAFRDNFLADPVAGDYCDVQCHDSIFPRPRAPGCCRSNPWSVCAVTCPIDEAWAGQALMFPRPSLTSHAGQVDTPGGCDVVPASDNAASAGQHRCGRGKEVGGGAVRSRMARG